MPSNSIFFCKLIKNIAISVVKWYNQEKTKERIMIFGDLKIFSKIPTLTTERLILRQMTMRDLKDVHEYASDPEVSKHLLWRPHPDLDYTRLYLETVKSGYKKCQFYDWGVVYNGKMIGTAGFTRFDIDNNSAEIGYVLSRQFWRMGIGFEAARCVIDFGFERLRLNRIEVHYMPENIESARLAERLGMRREGILRSAVRCKGDYRDVVVASVLRSEYAELFNIG